MNILRCHAHCIPAINNVVAHTDSFIIKVAHKTSLKAEPSLRRHWQARAYELLQQILPCMPLYHSTTQHSVSIGTAPAILHRNGIYNSCIYNKCTSNVSYLVAVSKGSGGTARGYRAEAADRGAAPCQAIVGGPIVPCNHEHLHRWVHQGPGGWDGMQHQTSQR